MSAEVEAFELELGFRLPSTFRARVLTLGVDVDSGEFLLEHMLKMFTRHTGCGIFLWLVVSGHLRGTIIIADGADVMINSEEVSEP
jgi:hypothetical protein